MYAQPLKTYLCIDKRHMKLEQFEHMQMTVTISPISQICVN